MDLDARGLQAALDVQPGDSLSRLALADWYEERGDLERAQFHRQLVQENKYPECLDLSRPYNRHLQGESEFVEGYWYWWLNGSEPVEASLPGWAGGIVGGRGIKSGFATRHKAEKALYRVWKKQKGSFLERA